MNPSQGGPPQGIRSSIDALAEIGLKNEVLTCDEPTAPWIGRDSFPVHAIGPGRFGYSYSQHLVPWLRQNSSHFDAVVLHGMWQWPGLALLRSSVPRFFLMPHGMLDPWFQRDASRRAKAIRNFFYWWLVERQVVNSAAGVLFTCEEEMRLARTSFSGYNPRKEIIVGYGISSPPNFSEKIRSALSQKLPDLKKHPYLLFLGRIHPKKGVELLIQAYSEVLKTEKLTSSPPYLLIAGPGWETSYGNKIQKLIEASNSSILDVNTKLRADNSPPIRMVGMLEGDAKWGALYGCEAFILPSHQENFGIAVVEALACNKPVIITNKVNIWSEIAESNAGMIMSDDFNSIKETLSIFLRGIENDYDTRPSDCYKKYFKITDISKKMINALASP